MVRLRVREVAEATRGPGGEEEPRINRAKLGRVADVSATTMDKIWLDEGYISVRLDTLLRIADALSTLKNRKITVHDLIAVD